MRAKDFVVEDLGILRKTGNWFRNIGRDSDAPIKMMTNPKNQGAVTGSGKPMDIKDFPLQTIDITMLKPWEPMIKMQDLPSQRNVASMVQKLQQGQDLPPLLVTPVRGGYRIIDGHHRYAAYQRAEKNKIPVRVVDPKLIRYSDEVMEALRITVKRYGHLRKVKELAMAEDTVNEYRNALYDFVKSKFSTWPEYVLKDFLYAQAKGIRDKEELKDFLDRNQKDFGQVNWRLEKLSITIDIFTPKTQRMIKQREGGSSNPSKVPRDAERHELQAKIIQQKGVSLEPIIVAKLSNGYDLIEGWHRTIQHLKAYPEGYTGPAWVAYGATYTSEDVEENFADGKKPGRKGLAKRMKVPTKASVSRLRQIAKNSSGEKQRMAHWLANMKAGRKKK